MGQHFSSTSQNFPTLSHSGFNVDETIKQSLKQAEDLKKFIAKREYETNLELEKVKNSFFTENEKSRGNSCIFFKENAHFLLSEMLLASIEQMKWRNIISTKAAPVFQNRPFRKFSNTEVIKSRPQTKLPSFNEDILATNSRENVNSYCDELDRTVGDFTDSHCGSLSDLQAHTVSDKSDEASDTGYSTSIPRYVKFYSAQGYIHWTEGGSKRGKLDVPSALLSDVPFLSLSLSLQLDGPCALKPYAPSVSDRMPSALWLDAPSALQPDVSSDSPTLLSHPLSKNIFLFSSNNQIELFENSAELVAMNLLQNFSKKHFPQANNMQFLVSYKDAPQLVRYTQTIFQRIWI